jgi:hypothetical protein
MARDTRRPHPRRVRPKPVRINKKSGGACSMAIPAAAVRTVLALARLAVAEWQIRGAP